MIIILKGAAHVQPLRGRRAHRTRNEEAGEEEPDGVEGGGDDSRELNAGRDGDCHHAVEGEVQEGEVGKQQVPEKLGCTHTPHPQPPCTHATKNCCCFQQPGAPPKSQPISNLSTGIFRSGGQAGASC